MTKPTPEPDQLRKRAIIIVLDGAGAGALPDADDYGDLGSDTLRNVIRKHGPLDLKNLYSLGLGEALKLSSVKRISKFSPVFYGLMAPLSPGKDTTSGHWEISGIVMESSFPVFPDGFPRELIDRFSKEIGRGVLGNIAASGTEIIERLGEKHIKTGFPIIYTSADSVFQIAAHEKIVPLETLYHWSEIARSLLTGKNAVGRVIARPFVGEPGSFKRTAGRHDYSLSPPGKTLLDTAMERGYPVAVVGKVADIFAHRGMTITRPGGDNDALAEELIYLLENVESGLIWTTFGDFDTLYGHRNDSKGFALALEKFDRHLEIILKMLGKDDLLFITADHGCDPTFPTTDHTREYVPLLAWNREIQLNKNLGIRKTYADLAASAADWLDLTNPGPGVSFIP
ncbi:MAG: phosphopentomutase [Bacillota bacterium]|nr:phosphopentomutase [Bacillota bacterium]